MTLKEFVLLVKLLGMKFCDIFDFHELERCWERGVDSLENLRKSGVDGEARRLS